MSESVPGSGYNRAKEELRAAVEEDGGVMGIFHLLNNDERWQETLDHYGQMLAAAASPDDQQVRGIAHASSGLTQDEKITNNLNALGAVFTELSIHELPAMLLALQICQTAFPEKIPPEEFSGTFSANLEV